MLAELVEYLLTPCGKPARRLGYLRESVAIRARHRRCGQAWAPHLARCRDIILQAAEACPKRDLVLVLGSGALLDIPLPALADMFRQVILADLVHPLAARRQARALANVRLVEADLSGALPEILARKAPPVPPPVELFMDLAPDLTVSANLLSQLPLLPSQGLAKAGCEPKDVEAFAVGLMRRHLDWLRRLPGVVCLITDISRTVGQETTDLVHGLAPEVTGQTWPWLIAPCPELYPDRDVSHLVSGVIWTRGAQASR